MQAQGAQVWPSHQSRQQSKNNFKVVFLGKSGVGKTSVTLRFCRDMFLDGTEATIGYVLWLYSPCIPRWMFIPYIWLASPFSPIGGQNPAAEMPNPLLVEMSDWLHPSLSSSSASFLTKMMTFNDRSIKFELWDTAGQERYRALAPMYYRNADAAVLVFDVTDNESFEALQSWFYELQKNVPDCIIVLCGNKLDLESQRKVTKEAAAEYANEKECPLIEVSSKTGQNIPELFNKLGSLLTTKFQA